jgi:uncharacterized LabA/DUF88 family protein
MQLAVFIDFDNIEIGVKTTLNCELDLALVLDSLRERGEVLSKSAYGDWARAGQHSRTLTDHAVHMVQRNVTPRGDKNGADINLVVDALEMAFTRPHISGFAIVGGDSDFIALVEKLKQFGKRVFVVGGRSFTSGILQRNCHEFIAYENLLAGSRSARSQQSRGPSGGRLPLAQGLEKVQRALKILADRGVEPQLGPLKSTLLQLDSTFSERDYGASSFREFIQRLADRHHLALRRIDQGYLVETNGESAPEVDRAPERVAPRTHAAPLDPSVEEPIAAAAQEGDAGAAGRERRPAEEAVELLRRAAEKIGGTRGGRPTYVRHLAQALRSVDPDFDETRYGFRTLTELMHVGAREGIFKMQRDRQGAWRVTVDAVLDSDALERDADGRDEDASERAAAAVAGASHPGHETGASLPSDDEFEEDARGEAFERPATTPRHFFDEPRPDDRDFDRPVDDDETDEEPGEMGVEADEQAPATTAGEPETAAATKRKRSSRGRSKSPTSKSSSRGRRGGAKKKAAKATEPEV